MKKRCVGIFLLMCIVLGMVCSFPVAAFAAGNTWEDYKDTSIFDNKNQMEYVITTPEQLAGFAYVVNNIQDSFLHKTVKLGNNIDLKGHDWIPIDYSGVKIRPAAGFWGTFDGNGKTISNMTIKSNSPSPYGTLVEVGFFGRCDGVIKDLTLENIDITSSADVVGGLCGALTTYSDQVTATAKNCAVTGGKITSGAYYQNAAIGRNHRAIVTDVSDSGVTMAADKLWSRRADTTIFEKDQPTYDISTPEQLAGFAKMLNESKTTFKGKTVTLLNSIDLSKWEWVPAKNFEGTFDGDGNAILGMKITPEFSPQNAGFFASSSGTIKNLTVSGDIEVRASGVANAGMISATSSADISNCYTYGTINNYPPGQRINTGGVVGLYNGGNGIKNCINAVDVASNGGASSFIGGLIGNWQTDNTFPHDAMLYRCANVGNITGGRCAGGLVGAITYDPNPTAILEKKMLIMDCAVSDEVIIDRANDYAGGFVGQLVLQDITNAPSMDGKETVQIANSYSTATIKNPGKMGAGIIGHIYWMWGSGLSNAANTPVKLSNIYSASTLDNVPTYVYFANMNKDAIKISVSTYKNFIVCIGEPSEYGFTTSDGGRYNETNYKNDTKMCFPDDRQHFAWTYDVAAGKNNKYTFAEGSLTGDLDANSKNAEIATLISGTPSGWEELSDFNKKYPVLKEVKLRDFYAKLPSVSKATISVDPQASLEKTSYYDLQQQQQLTADKETGFMLRMERMFANKEHRNVEATSWESIKFGTPLPTGTKVTLRTIKSDFSGYEDGEYTTEVTTDPTREIVFNNLTKDGNTIARLPQSKEKRAYDVFFNFENASFSEYSTTYTVTVNGKPVPGTGEPIVVKDLPKSDVTFEYDESAGMVKSGSSSTVISPDTPVRILNGTSPSFFIAPEISYKIEKLTINGTAVSFPSGGNLAIENISADTTVKIDFKKRTYDVTLDAASAGAQTSISLPAEVEYGDTLDFKVSAKDGYAEDSIVTVKANDDVLTADAGGKYSLANITKNTKISITGFTDVAPTVNTVAPSGTRAPLSGTITVVFSEAIREAYGALTLKLDGSSLPPISLNGRRTDAKTYTAEYAGLAPQATYTVNVSGFRDLAGNEMDEDSTHSFKTGKATPAVALDIRTDATQTSPAIILTAKVSSGFSPTGTVDFFIGNEFIDTAPIDTASGTATLTPSHIPPKGDEEYMYYAVYSGDEKHNTAESQQKPYTLGKSDGAITIKNDISKVYDTKPVTPPETGQNSTGAVTIEYSADGINYTTTPPTDVGSYTVRATLAPDNQYNGAEAWGRFEITPADPTYTAPSYFLVMEGTKLGDIDLSPYAANGTFAWKTPEADVGAVGSKTDFELQFIPDTKNYKKAEGIMVSVEVRRKSITPTAQSSTIGGVNASYTAGETITFTAAGSGMDNTTPLSGDTRWRPASWKCNPEGVFADGSYTASFVLDTAGNYELAVTFEEEVYDGTGFEATGNTYTESTPILINAVNAAPTGKKAAATDDNTPLLPYSLLALLSATLLAVVRVNKKRPE